MSISFVLLNNGWLATAVGSHCSLAGGWTFGRTRWLTFINFSCNAKLHTFYHISFTAAIYSSTISDRISSVHISDSASVFFFSFSSSFSFQQKQQQKQWQQYSAFLWTNYNILCVYMPCHAYSYMLAKRMKGIGLELVYSWIWTLLFSPCMKLCVFFFAWLLTMFRFSLSKLFAIYFE